MSGNEAMAGDAIRDFIESRASAYDALALDIWEHPETSGGEERSSAVHRKRLAASGFRIREFPELAWSFSAEKGSGRPIIAIMGEYDALPGMSQACAATREPRVAGAPGHACGHNLLGLGSLAAAEALAAALEAAGLPGTVRYYGCPAEEALGRIPLVKAGRFDDADAALTWHPADVNTPHRYTTSANIALVFRFRGRASHAGMAPHAGRSALDGAQIFNIGLEFLREHVEKGVLIHYVISDGGARPNIVPESAATSLYLRAPTAEALRLVAARVIKAAKGAAMMTETRVSHEITHGKCDFIPIAAIHDRMASVMEAMPLPALTPAELAFAKALVATIPKRDREATLAPIGAPAALLKRPVHAAVGDFGAGYRIGGSLDTGDVSYVTPTGQLNAATWPLGVGAHTWQSCAASGSTAALKHMRWAAAALAATGYALATQPALQAAAKAEHAAKTRPYRSTMDL
jgi:aminobenzoyl-glutamate utilization protein B